MSRGREIAEAGVAPFQVVVALRLGNLVRGAGVPGLLRHPDPAVVAERLAHQRQLRLIVAALGDAGRVDLGEAGIGEVCAALVGPPDGRDVGALRVGGQIEDVPVPAGAEDHGVAHVGLDLARDHVTHHDAARPPVHDDQVQHLGAGEHADPAGGDFLLELLVGPEQELLAGLSPRVECPGHLGSAERAIGQEPAVLPGEWDALGHALVDDVDADLGQPVDVGLAGPEVTALHRVVEQAEDAVAVVPVVLGGIDSALRGDAVGPPGRILEAEALHVVAELAQRGGRGGAGQPAAHDQHGVFPLVRGVHQLHLEAMLVPLALDGARGNSGVQRHADVSMILTPPRRSCRGRRPPRSR